MDETLDLQGRVPDHAIEVTIHVEEDSTISDGERGQQRIREGHRDTGAAQLEGKASSSSPISLDRHQAMDTAQTRLQPGELAFIHRTGQEFELDQTAGRHQITTEQGVEAFLHDWVQ